MAGKLFFQPELAKIKEWILQEMAFTSQSITNSIATEGTTLVCRGVESLHGGPPKELDGVSASDLDVTVKDLDKGVRERLRSMQPRVILKEVNINIERDPSIPKLSADIPGSLTDPMARAVAFKHLRSGDVTISVRKDEGKTLLSRSTKWIEIFGPECYAPKGRTPGDCPSISLSRMVQVRLTHHSSVVHPGWPCSNYVFKRSLMKERTGHTRDPPKLQPQHDPESQPQHGPESQHPQQ
ncbi:hypothetical protein MMC31_005978 [Peltigera leucophlebia]|nr:hypothetical protein [Peltigera leucophlebia]